MDTTASEEVAVIGVRAVIEMFEKVNLEISQIKQKPAHPNKQQQKAVIEQVEQGMQPTFSHYNSELKELKNDLSEVKQKNKLLNEVTQYNISLMEDLASRLDSVEMTIAKKSAILSGLFAASRKDILIKQTVSFLEDTLDL